MEKTSFTTKEQYVSETFNAAIKDATQNTPFGKAISRQAMLASPGYHVHEHLLGEVWDLTERLEQVENDTEEDCLDSVKDIADLQEKFEVLADALDIIQSVLMLQHGQRDRVRKAVERLKKPLPTEQDDEPGFGKMLIIDDIQRLDGVRQVTIGGRKVQGFDGPAVVHIGKNNEQLSREARVAGTQDLRGRPGYARPAVNEQVPGYAARADMLSHPDTVYERVGTHDKYRFHNGLFDKKDNGTTEFRSRNGRTGFDCQNGQAPYFVTSSTEKFFRVDTAAPLTFTGHALLAKLKAEPGQVYQSEVYQIHWDAKAGTLMWRTQHSAMPSSWQKFNGFPARQYKRTEENVTPAPVKTVDASVATYQGEDLVAAMKADPQRIFFAKVREFTHEAFWMESTGTLMHRYQQQSNTFAQAYSLGFKYTRSDRVYVGKIFGIDTTAKAPIGVKYTDKPKELEVGRYYPMTECDADMRQNPGRVYRAEDQNGQMVYIAWDGKRFYMKRTLYGGWVFATVTTRGQGMRCGDHIRGPIHSSLPNPGRTLPNVRR